MTDEEKAQEYVANKLHRTFDPNDKQMRMLADAFERGIAEGQRWIDFEQEQPMADGIYLFAIKGHDKHSSIRVELSVWKYGKYQGNSYMSVYLGYDKIVAWLPIPCIMYNEE